MATARDLVSHELFVRTWLNLRPRGRAQSTYLNENAKFYQSSTKARSLPAKTSLLNNADNPERIRSSSALLSRLLGSLLGY